MPSKGTTCVPLQKRVDIVIAKAVRADATDTRLSQEFGVSKPTIRKYKYEKLSPEGQALYNEQIQNLKPLSASLTEAALEKSLELVRTAETAKDLTGVVAAGKFGYEVHRLENDKSTSNIGMMISPLQATIELVERCKVQGFSRQEILEGIDQIPDIDPEVKERVKNLLL